jgi:hypothetical protein
VVAGNVIVSQFNAERTALVTEEDLALPMGTVFTLGDSFQWDPYSVLLTRKSINPNFFDITLEVDLPSFRSRTVAAMAHVLEQSVVAVDE